MIAPLLFLSARRAGVAVGERGVCVCVCEGRAGALGWRCRARAGPSVGLFLTPRRKRGKNREGPRRLAKGGDAYKVV